RLEGAASSGCGALLDAIRHVPHPEKRSRGSGARLEERRNAMEPHSPALRAGRLRSYMCSIMCAMPSHALATERRNLVGLIGAELAEQMAGFGAEPFLARQLWHWIYHRGSTDFAAMTNLAKGFRERLAETYELRRPGISRALLSADGTRKWLLRFDDAQEIETVHIPESDRGTLCVSSQVGCTLTCTFCHTGTQRLV